MSTGFLDHEGTVTGYHVRLPSIRTRWSSSTPEHQREISALMLDPSCSQTMRIGVACVAEVGKKTPLEGCS